MSPLLEPERVARNAYSKKWRGDNPEKRKAIKRRSELKTKYGITPEQFAVISASQDDHCALCPATSSQQRYGVLVVDHDHKSGRVRGLLCVSCNMLVGRLADGIAGVARVLRYLIGGLQIEDAASTLDVSPA
jgi:hypothetical protein